MEVSWFRRGAARMPPSKAAADRASEISKRSLKAVVDGLAALASRNQKWGPGRLAQACHAAVAVSFRSSRRPNESHSGGECAVFRKWVAAAQGLRKRLRRPLALAAVPSRSMRRLHPWPNTPGPVPSPKFEGHPRGKGSRTIVSSWRKASAPWRRPWDGTGGGHHVQL